MIHLHRIPKHSSGIQLAVVIRELELPEKEYEQFRFRLRDNEWQYIDVVGKDTRKSEMCVFSNLLYDTTYKISAEYRLNGEWITVSERTFITQDFDDSPPQFISGGIRYKKGDA